MARTILLRRLAAAPRTRAQLAADLAAREVPTAVAERVLDRFAEVGLVDDAAFAETWVRTRHAGRGLSRSALRRELRDKGVDDETVAGAVDAIDVDDEAAGRPGPGGPPAAGYPRPPPGGADPTAGRAAGPQGLSRRDGDGGGPRGAGCRRWRRARATTSTSCRADS